MHGLPQRTVGALAGVTLRAPHPFSADPRNRRALIPRNRALLQDGPAPALGGLPY